MNTLITCHHNADFDALASIIAASALYPGASLLFPGTQERKLHKLYEDILIWLYDFKPAKEIDFQTIERLVVVDTCLRERLPHVATLLDKEDVEIHIWDHHPDSTDLPNVTSLRVEKIGATVTLLVEEIQARGLNLGCEKASLSALGIYGDTGAFTFPTTTPREFRAAEWLREQGMDLQFIAEMMQSELNKDQIHALNDLLETAETRNIDGITLVVATTRFDVYVNDFAILTSKFRELQPCKVFFGLGAMEDKVQVVARSQSERVDVGEICRRLGGGGHAEAASASVKDKTIPQIRDFIFEQFSVLSNQDKTAGSLMSSPALGVETWQTIRTAKEIMTRYGFKALPIFRDGTKICVGWFELHLADRAINHGLGEVKVSAYMQRNFKAVTRNEGLQTLMDLIVGSRQRLLPVVDGPNLPALPDNATEENKILAEEELKNRPVIGVVTRTDLIRMFSDESNLHLPQPRKDAMRKRNLNKTMRAYIDSSTVHLLEIAGRLGDKMSLNVYVVGGFVRDLLLRQSNADGVPDMDIDLMVEGDSIAFAHALAAELAGRVNEHKEFMTAVVLFPTRTLNKLPPSDEEMRIDVASARVEYYASPAALPTVESSSLKTDLYRRDFTINAMAIQLNHHCFGLLIDYFDGQIDIRQQRIRLLHALSFVEDPTRMLRAVRFEQRHNFRIGQQTERLIRNALDLGLMDKLSGKRIVAELELILHEERALGCFVRLQSLDILAAIHPELIMPPWKLELLGRLLKITAWHRHLYLPEKPNLLFLFILSVCRNSSKAALQEVLTRLELSELRKAQLTFLRASLMEELPWIMEWQKHGEKISALYEHLRQIPLEGLLYLTSRVQDEELHKQLTLFIYQGRNISADIQGGDLKHMRLRPGPAYGRILRQVLAAKLDGEAVSRQAQLDLAATLVAAELVACRRTKS